jgi:hypothetical protein
VVDTPVTIMGAGDIAGSLATAGATGDLIRAADPEAVFTLGDNAYEDGSPSEFATKYDPAWGSFKDKTHPVPGNHEYHATPPQGYLDYFGAANVTNPVDGGVYYAWDVGNGWRAYALNTEISTSGAQLTWLKEDVAAHPGMHYILYTHHPRYTSAVNHSGSASVCPLWNALASTGGLEIVLTGHNHTYERFAKMDCAGREDNTGARSFVVGTGGKELYSFGTPALGSQFRDADDFGVLSLELHSTSYQWSFIASGTGRTGSTHAAGQEVDGGTQLTNGVPNSDNVAPSVSAGGDQVVTLPGSVSLHGTVTDDGLPDPPGTVTTSWSALRGPGSVTFTDASALDTTASFSEAGAYVLQLTGDDSAATAADTVSVTVQSATGGGSTQTTEVRVTAGSDDAEQRIGGSTWLGQSGLDLGGSPWIDRVVGIRFPGLQIPAGATVTKAYVQFQAAAVSTTEQSLTISVENSVDVPTYTFGEGTIVARAVTGEVPWAPPPWPTLEAVGEEQRTPDLASLVQAVVDQPGWVDGNAMAFQISGTTGREAESFEGSRSGAPLLHVEYTVEEVTSSTP